MITAMSCLTLEIYYPYLALYKVDAAGKTGSTAKGPAAVIGLPLKSIARPLV